ncbi:MAG: hypothetical protein ACI87E_005058, partial [Mariniblastus sp.]
MPANDVFQSSIIWLLVTRGMLGNCDQIRVNMAIRTNRF